MPTMYNPTTEETVKVDDDEVGNKRAEGFVDVDDPSVAHLLPEGGVKKSKAAKAES